MPRVVTTEDVRALPKGARHVLEPGALVTQAARELAEAMGIELAERAADTPGGCATSARACPAPGPAALPAVGLGATRGLTAAIWSDLAGRQAPGAGHAAAPPPAAEAAPHQTVAGDAVGRVLGRPETHLDGCYLRGEPCERENMVVVTALGRNRPRVLAELATAIADQEGDIQEISQRIVGGHFHAILTVDIGRSGREFGAIKAALEQLSTRGDYMVHVQHEKVFKYMHRI